MSSKEKPIILRPTELHWIGGATDDPTDLCAHSGVDFQIGDTVLIRPGDGEYAVSAAALFLLRTLSKSHTKASPVGAQLFPHCGQLVCASEGDEALVFCCDTGVDFEIRHVQRGYDLVTSDERIFHIPSADWREAVSDFSDAVDAFFCASSPKAPFDDDASNAFRQFLNEWKNRRATASLSFPDDRR